MKYTYNREEMQKKVFGFIYGCAMHDAILQRAFPGKKTWIGEVQAPKELLSKYICKVLDNGFSSQQEHDAFFLETANQICAEINRNKPKNVEAGSFSFGNAQKLMNIVVKHVYTFCYHTPALREGFRFCHCPVDAIMLDKVWKLGKGTFDLGLQCEFCKPWGGEGLTADTQSVLKSFPPRYALFQKTIRDLIGSGDLFPIEFDYVEWKT